MEYCKLPNSWLQLVVIGWVAVILTCKAQSSSNNNQKASVNINGAATIAKVDPKFICATLDWWPPEKCDYGTCSWGLVSILNLDLSNRLLQNAVKGLSPFLRLGGTLQEKVVYQVGNIQSPCLPFAKTSDLFGYSDGCLNMSRWDALNQFFQATSVSLAFGLNALYNRETDTAKAWDSSNARDFIQYTANKSYQVEAWELGNELYPSGVGKGISLSQYAADIKALRAIVDAIYQGSPNKPLVVAPDGFYDESAFQNLLESTGPNVIDVVTQHIYNLGPGVSANLVPEILDPSNHQNGEGPFRSVENMLQNHAPWAKSWVGEAGGAYNSGHHLVTDAFVFGFWYLDQLGLAAKHDTKVYCRQSMIGGNYGLLDHSTFKPNPDYFSALLWKKLMGTDVLSATVDGSSNLRAYAHCTNGDAQSITVLLLNLDTTTRYTVNLAVFYLTPSDSTNASHLVSAKSSKNTQSAHRLEYHLTAPSGNLTSQSMLLNGKLLEFSVDDEVPDMNGTIMDASEPVQVNPTSIVFVKLPGVSLAACNQASGA